MGFYGCGRGRGRPCQEQALRNPIRFRIVALFTEDETRSLTAKSIASDLATADRRFANVWVRQVGYHLACLRDAGLIPVETREGH